MIAESMKYKIKLNNCCIFDNRSSLPEITTQGCEINAYIERLSQRDMEMDTEIP